MASTVQICNLALARIGERSFIASLTDNTTNAQVCNAIHDLVRDAVLESFPWPFAARAAALAQLAGIVRDDWNYGFALPADCLVPLSIFAGTRRPTDAQKVPFVVELNAAGTGKMLLCDMAAPTLSYTAAITDSSLFPPLFVDALAWRLAIDLAKAIPNKGDYAQQAFGMFQQAIASAKASALGESFESTPESDIITIRG